MKNIVACVDFSATTSSVVETAAALATALRTKLYLLNVVVVQKGTGYETVPMLGQNTAEKIHRGRARLNELREPLLQHGLDISTILLEESRSSVKAIAEEARRVDAGLIVIGSHGHGALHRMLMGSTAEGVLHKSTCPVVVVPARPTEQASSKTRRAAAVSRT